MDTNSAISSSSSITKTRHIGYFLDKLVKKVSQKCHGPYKSFKKIATDRPIWIFPRSSLEQQKFNWGYSEITDAILSSMKHGMACLLQAQPSRPTSPKPVYTKKITSNLHP